MDVLVPFRTVILIYADCRRSLPNLSHQFCLIYCADSQYLSYCGGIGGLGPYVAREYAIEWRDALVRVEYLC